MKLLEEELSRLALPLLVPLAGVYRGLMKIRNSAYDMQWLPTFDVGCPVMSIGNITVGGTGKTPISALLLAGFLERGKKPGLVSRGYGGSELGPAHVPADGSSLSAARYGDEPALLAAQFPQVPVVICGDRVRAAQHLLSHHPEVDLILADDAFQHRRLKRGLDIVVVDATEPLTNYRPLPWGREREDISSLNRAHVVFITKCNLADPDSRQLIRERVGAVTAPRKTIVFEMESVLAGFTEGGNSLLRSVVPVDQFSDRRVLLVSGIGRPQSFFRLIAESSGVKILDHLVYPDHHPYAPVDFKNIEEKASMLGADSVVVTEKDAVKMMSWSSSVPWFFTRLEMRSSERDLGEFYEVAHRLFI